MPAARRGGEELSVPEIQRVVCDDANEAVQGGAPQGFGSYGRCAALVIGQAQASPTELVAPPPEGSR